MNNGISLRMSKNSSWLGDAGYTMGQQQAIYEDLLDDVIANPRWYLDQLEYFAEFRVSWVNYGKQRVTQPLALLKAKRSKTFIKESLPISKYII